MSNFDRKDVYTRVTERIIADLEQALSKAESCSTTAYVASVAS